MGFLVGPNLSGIGSQNLEGAWISHPKLDLHIGVFTETRFGRWSLEPALMYIGAGAKINYGNFGTNEGETISAQYLQLPVTMVYNTQNRKFFLGAGPYAGLGLAINVNDGASYGGVDGSSYSTLNYNDKFIGGRFDYGINMLGGLRLAKTMLTLGGSLGLRKATTNDIFTIRNEMVRLSIWQRIF